MGCCNASWATFIFIVLSGGWTHINWIQFQNRKYLNLDVVLKNMIECSVDSLIGLGSTVLIFLNYIRLYLPKCSLKLQD